MGKKQYIWLVISVCIGSVFGAYYSINSKLEIAHKYIFEVAAKDNLTVILTKLKHQGLLNLYNYYGLRLYAKLTGADRNIKIGEYAFTAGTTGIDLIKKLVSGKVELHKFTIIEGMRFEQIMQNLHHNPMLHHTLSGECSEILLILNTHDLGINVASCEGLFMPNTYFFPKGTKDVVILQQAYDLLQQRLNDLWENGWRGELKSRYEALIMGSIIQKETALVQEMKRVSGVYHRRLQLGIPLQADPTVIYGLKIYDRFLTRNDLKKPSGYNTYLNKGLPPGPIAIPSIAAIFAALNPMQGQYLYFVADGTGGHIFSNSLLEHNNAILKIKNDRLLTAQEKKF